MAEEREGERVKRRAGGCWLGCSGREGGWGGGGGGGGGGVGVACGGKTVPCRSLRGRENCRTRVGERGEQKALRESGKRKKKKKSILFVSVARRVRRITREERRSCASCPSENFLLVRRGEGAL